MNYGLKPLPPDTRDFKFGAVYTLPKLSELPTEYILMWPLKIRDQKETDYCAAEAFASVSEDQEGVELDPLYQFYLAKQLDGDPNGWGVNLRVIAKSGTKFGSLEARYAQYTIDSPRSEIVTGTKYTEGMRQLATQHKKESFMFINGPYDTFDNLRATLWKKRFYNQSVLTGLSWCQEWTKAPSGVIDFPGTPGYGHAFKIFGWKQIKGKPYLVAQLSNGTEIGDRGIFYFSREIINSDLKFGSLVFTDLPVEDAKYYLDNKIKADTNWLIQLLKLLLNLLVEKLKTLKKKQ
jgi:hypothetical protein